MRKTMKHVLLLCTAIAIVLSIVGCASFGGFMFIPKKGGSENGGSEKRGSAHEKGEVVVITGKVVRHGNQFTLEDRGSNDVFRFVGLRKDDDAAFERLAGRVVSIRLRIISVESAKSINAQLVAILQ
jgi:flagellar basal body-associated protein FliL